jgi:hypothetical protein
MSQTIKIDPNEINEDMINSFKMSMDPKAIPDLGLLLEIINEMIQFIETPEMEELEVKDFNEFERLVYTRYNSKVPIKIIGLMVEESRYDNLSQLLDMFEALEDVKKGKRDIFEETEKFNEKQNNKYVYPKFGGKENFEKMLAETGKNKKKPKRKIKKSKEQNI